MLPQGEIPRSQIPAKLPDAQVEDVNHRDTAAQFGRLEVKSLCAQRTNSHSFDVFIQPEKRYESF